jgi:hypothetical protein
MATVRNNGKGPRIMKEILLAISLFLVGNVSAYATETLKYEPAVVRLVGKLVSGTGETPDEAKVKFPAIKLQAPVRVQGTPKDDWNQTEEGVSLMQLIIFDEKAEAQYKSLKGKEVVVTGKLMHSQTGGHYTPVLVQVQRIEKK